MKDNKVDFNISPERWDSKFTWHKGDLVMLPTIVGKEEALQELYLGKITPEKAVERLVACGAFGGSVADAKRCVFGQMESWKTSIPNVLSFLKTGRCTADAALNDLLQMCVDPAAAKQLVADNLPGRSE